MKNKILILSLAANIIAGLSLLYAFSPKAGNPDNSSGTLVMNVYHVSSALYKSEISVSDGNSITEQTDLQSGWIPAKQRENNKIIANKINEIQSKGYELVSSNNASDGGYMSTNYIFVKK